LSFTGHRGIPLGVLSIGIILIGGLGKILCAQAASSNQDGIYTVEQAQKGQVVYKAQCASCHGDALQGSGKNVPLVGDKFLDKWNNQSLADLFMKTNTTMPNSDPGSLTPDETAQVLAYILQENKLQAGKKELPTDPEALQAIQIHKP
jgi:mono/diheme cytochrome c family protein